MSGLWHKAKAHWGRSSMGMPQQRALYSPNYRQNRAFRWSQNDEYRWLGWRACVSAVCLGTRGIYKRFVQSYKRGFAHTLWHTGKIGRTIAARHRKVERSAICESDICPIDTKCGWNYSQIACQSCRFDGSPYGNEYGWIVVNRWNRSDNCREHSGIFCRTD